MLKMSNIEFRESYEHVRRWYLSDGGYLGFHRVHYNTVISASIWSNLLVWKTKLDDYYRVVSISEIIMHRIVKDLGLEIEYCDVLIAETEEEWSKLNDLSIMLSDRTDKVLREWYKKGDINAWNE